MNLNFILFNWDINKNIFVKLYYFLFRKYYPLYSEQYKFIMSHKNIVFEKTILGDLTSDECNRYICLDCKSYFYGFKTPYNLIWASNNFTSIYNFHNFDKLMCKEIIIKNILE